MQVTREAQPLAQHRDLAGLLARLVEPHRHVPDPHLGDADSAKVKHPTRRPTRPPRDSRSPRTRRRSSRSSRRPRPRAPAAGHGERDPPTTPENGSAHVQCDGSSATSAPHSTSADHRRGAHAPHGGNAARRAARPSRPAAAGSGRSRRTPARPRGRTGRRRREVVAREQVAGPGSARQPGDADSVQRVRRRIHCRPDSVRSITANLARGLTLPRPCHDSCTRSGDACHYRRAAPRRDRLHGMAVIEVTRPAVQLWRPRRRRRRLVRRRARRGVRAARRQRRGQDDDRRGPGRPSGAGGRVRARARARPAARAPRRATAHRDHAPGAAASPAS